MVVDEKSVTLPVQVQVVEQVDDQHEIGGQLTEEAVRNMLSSDDEHGGPGSAGWASGRASLHSNGTNFVSCDGDSYEYHSDAASRSASAMKERAGGRTSGVTGGA